MFTYTHVFDDEYESINLSFQWIPTAVFSCGIDFVYEWRFCVQLIWCSTHWLVLHCFLWLVELVVFSSRSFLYSNRSLVYRICNWRLFWRGFPLGNIRTRKIFTTWFTSIRRNISSNEKKILDLPREKNCFFYFSSIWWSFHSHSV